VYRSELVVLMSFTLEGATSKPHAQGYTGCLIIGNK